MNHKKQRVIVITGASAGIGRAIAQEFAKQGAKLGLIARGEEKLDSTVAEIFSMGGECHCLSLRCESRGGPGSRSCGN